MGVWSVVKAIFGFAIKAFQAAKARGLTDALVAKALELARFAAVRFVENTERRTWVIEHMISSGVPESIARLALELAVQQLKKEAGK